jgi:ribonuclease HI
MTPVTANSAPSTSNQLDFANGDSANVASFENAQLEQHTNRLLSAADPLSQSQGYHRLNYHHAPALASQPISEPGSTPGTSGVVSLDQQYFQSEVLHERFLANCEKLPGRMNRFEVLGDQTQAEMCEEYSQLGDGMEVDSGPLRTSQSSEMPEDKGSEQFPPYVKAMMKKLESMSYAIQQQTKTNPKLADNLGMLVEKFARMEERMNAVQAENVNLLEILKHSKWIDSLPKRTVLLYTDGSRSIIGDVGAGWVGFHKQDSGLLRIFEGYCYLGRSMEVYDAEIHAVKEALSTLRTISKLVPCQIYIYIDNSAAISVLGDNPNRVQGATEACEVALALVNSGWAIQSVWAPRHIGIGGNEIADNLAKKGTYPNNNLCTASYTSKAWIERKAREIFLGRWRLNIGSENLSWKYPSEWEGWTYREARAYFRTYSGRTDIDPRHEHEATKCKCSTADLSSDHIIGYCPLFDQARSCIRGQDLTPPVFTKEMILDKNWGPGIRTFVKKTGLGFKSELRWPKQDLEYKSEAESDDEDEFEVGEFE